MGELEEARGEAVRVAHCDRRGHGYVLTRDERALAPAHVACPRHILVDCEDNSAVVWWR